MKDYNFMSMASYDLIRKVMDVLREFPKGKPIDKRWEGPTFEEFFAIGYSVGNEMQSERREKKLEYVVVGGDSRMATPQLCLAMAEGLAGAGVKVLYAGHSCTTPVVEYVARKYNACSCMVTASHLEYNHNGIKFAEAKQPFIGEDKFDLSGKVESNQRIFDIRERARQDYLKSVKELKINCNGRKIVVDYMDGSGSKWFPDIAEIANLNIVESLNEGATGNFAGLHNRMPDPSLPKNIGGLLDALRQSDAELGVAFDGDADRHVFAYKAGNEARALDTILLTAVEAEIYSRALPDLAKIGLSTENFGFVLDPFLTPVIPMLEELGFKYVVAKRGRPEMITTILNVRDFIVLRGREGSYHGFDRNGFDDGMKHVLYFASLLEGDGRAVSEIIESAKKNLGLEYTIEMRVACLDNDKYAAVQKKVEDIFRQRGYGINTSDGLRADGLKIKTEGNGFVMRKSSRESVTSVLLYGTCEDAVKKVGKQISRIAGKECDYKDFADALQEKVEETLAVQREKYG